jgi:hypothetical protein
MDLQLAFQVPGFSPTTHLLKQSVFPFYNNPAVNNCFHTPCLKAIPGEEFYTLIQKFYESHYLMTQIESYYNERFACPSGLILNSLNFADSDISLLYYRMKDICTNCISLLDQYIQHYLIRAIAGEIRHLGKRSDIFKTYSVSAIQERFQSFYLVPFSLIDQETDCEKHCNHCFRYATDACHLPTLSRESSQNSTWVPCPSCNPQEALYFLQDAYSIFAEFKWTSAYGGNSWANIVSVLANRLYQQHPGLIKPDPGYHFSLKIPYEDYPFFSDTLLFLDNVIDLHHNSGCVFDKGWFSSERGCIDLFSIWRYQHRFTYTPYKVVWYLGLTNYLELKKTKCKPYWWFQNYRDELGKVESYLCAK